MTLNCAVRSTALPGDVVAKVGHPRVRSHDMPRLWLYSYQRAAVPADHLLV